MNVKQRLYLSNTLMLILPIVLMIVALLCIVLIYSGITGIRDYPPLKYSERFFLNMENVDHVAASEDSKDLVALKSAIDQFNDLNSSTDLNLSIYADNSLLYPLTLPEGHLVQFEARNSGTFMMVTEQVAFYRVDMGEYALVLTDSNYTIQNRNAFQQRLYGGIVMLVMLITVVIITNYALTKFVFRSIMNPIRILADGVHQLRDGNLTYRIHYEKQDEFAPVCADFNDMAQRLSVMVTERQKDEASRRELIAGISHDLRTPLTSIKAYLEGLEKGVAATPQMKMKYFATIKSKTESLEHIINQLFLFSKLDIGEFPLYVEKINIGNELKTMLTSFSAEYEPNGLTIVLEKKLSQEEVFIDLVQFRNVIQNILENSLKYKVKDKVEVGVKCFADEESMTIQLSDNGPGVPRDELEKLFDVFYRSDASRKHPESGSGLGLAISRKIIERFGGRISAQLGSLGGLEVEITLPLHKDTKGVDDEKNTNN